MKTKLPFEHRGNTGDDLGETAVPSLERLSHLTDFTLNLVRAGREVVGSN